MDNINMYRGRKRHHRLLKEVGPKMWNFTARAAVIPDLSDVTHLLSCKETTCEPQIDMTDLQPEDVFLGTNNFFLIFSFFYIIKASSTHIRHQQTFTISVQSFQFKINISNFQSVKKFSLFSSHFYFIENVSKQLIFPVMLDKIPLYPLYD